MTYIEIEAEWILTRAEMDVRLEELHALLDD